MQKCSKEGAGDEDEKMKRSEECKMTHVILHTKIRLTQLFLFFSILLLFCLLHVFILWFM